MTISNISRPPDFFSRAIEETVAPSKEAENGLITLMNSLERDALTIEKFDSIRAAFPEYQLTHRGHYRNIVCNAVLKDRIDLITHMVSIAGKELLELGSVGETPLVVAFIHCRYNTTAKELIDTTTVKGLIELGANVNLIFRSRSEYSSQSDQSREVTILEYLGFDEWMLINGARIQQPTAMNEWEQENFNMDYELFSDQIALVKKKEALITTTLVNTWELLPKLGDLVALYSLNSDEISAHDYIQAEAIVEKRAQEINETLLFPTKVARIINSYDDGEGYKDAQRARIGDNILRSEV